VVGAQHAQVSTVSDTSNVLRLPYAVVSVGAARRWVRTELAGLGVARALLDDVEVVVSELLANAVRHARPIAGDALLVAWRLTGAGVTVTVTDGGSPNQVELRGTGGLAETGRGLHIVQGLATEWGVIEQFGGLRTVWATVARDRGRATGGRGPRAGGRSRGWRLAPGRGGDPTG
jgi:anti-sigma regulatory factor (Ser/Thr protein kinase)